MGSRKFPGNGPSLTKWMNCGEMQIPMEAGGSVSQGLCHKGVRIPPHPV